MSVLKTVLASSVVLSTLALAGCQTTSEEQVYYASGPTTYRETVVVAPGPYYAPRPYYRPPVYVAEPPPRYYNGPTRWEPPHRRPPTVTSPGNPGRWDHPRPRGDVTNGPTPDPRYRPRREPNPAVNDR